MKRVEKSRYFLAIIPPVEISARVLEIKTYFRDHFNCKAPLRSPAHITLHMPFMFKETREAELVSKLKSLATNHTGFDLKLDGFGAFVPRTIYISVEPNATLISFQKTLAQFAKRELKLFNTNYKDQGYHPHITVAFRDLKKAQFPQAWDEFRDREFKAEFKVSSFWLLKHDGKEWQPQSEFTFGQGS
ncbi:MAG: 2'-5' RNA ligase family protein [Roseivirga sp.]|nr:2'-5' RNA ligase family protein [Roseivirga sp.]